MSKSSYNQKLGSNFISSPENLSKFIGPYGYIQCTCEKYPKITHINTQMIEYLDMDESNSDLEDFLKENIFFTMIPFNERSNLSNYLEQALNSTKPIHIEHRIRCYNNTYKSFAGWLSVDETNNNEKSFVFIYTPKDDQKQNSKDNSYFDALKNTYDIIFEISYINDTIECIHGKHTSNIGPIYDIVMTTQSAIDFWINNYIYEDDREIMRKYLEHICSSSSDWAGETSIQSKFRLKWEKDIVDEFRGIAIKIDPATVLFCVKKIKYPKFTISSKEIVALKKFDNLMEHFVKYDKDALGMFLYEQRGDDYFIVYATPEIREYLNISSDYYLRCISQEIPNEKCLKSLGFSKEKFKKLIEQKQLNYTVKINDSQSKDVLITLTSHNHNDDILHEILIFNKETVAVTDIPTSGIFVRTFGHFDLFIDGQPITFTNNKEKELLALLVDRNGGTLTANEAISYLWEDEEIDERTSAKYRKLAMGLKNTLAKHNIEHIVINNHGVRNINVSAITCDYYELLAGNEHYKKMFHNFYMSDYSWAEDTLATLWDYS